MTERVLITGASGFIGRHLTAALRRDGINVCAASRRRHGFGPDVDTPCIADLTQPVDWLPLLNGVDAVVHLAGVVHSRASTEIYDRVNRAATAELAAACAKAGVHLIFMSSIRAQVGASASRILTERDTPEPGDDYGRSKLAAENAVRMSGAPHTILRPTLVYGPGVKGNLAALLKLARSPWPLPFAALDNRRSLTGIDNLIAAIRFASDRPAANETYIVADPQPVTPAQIVAMLRRAMGREPGLFPVPPAVFAALLRAAGRGDMWQRLGGELIADPAKLTAAGWRPAVSTTEGLAGMVR